MSRAGLLLATTLAARNKRPMPFEGPYIPLGLSDGGQQALAFLRGTPENFAIILVPRLTFRKTPPAALRLTDDATSGISLQLPPAFEGRTVRSVLTGRTLTLSGEVPISEMLDREPVALFLSV